MSDFSKNSGHGSKLGRKKEQVIAALLRCRNHAEAARACGISVATITRYLRNPEFIEAYCAAKNQLVADATAQLRAAGADAVATLKRIAKDDKAPPAAQVSASRAILEFMLDAHQIEDLEQKIEQLEKAAVSETAVEVEADDVRQKLRIRLLGYRES